MALLHQGKYVRLVEDGGWEYVERTNASGVVAIIALTDSDELLLVEQYRKPVASRVIELPAGLAGDIAGQEDEDLSIAAIRELEEECGYTAASMEKLLVGPVSAGLCNEIITLYRASGVRKVGVGGGDESEDIEVHAIPRAEVATWLAAANARGVLVDPKVYAALYFLA
jgi:ADP-ribose pyrophosphatase